MADAPLRAGGRYAIKHATHTARAIVEALEDRVDSAPSSREPAPAELALNDIGRVRLRTSKPLVFDPYRATAPPARSSSSTRPRTTPSARA